MLNSALKREACRPEMGSTSLQCAAVCCTGVFEPEHLSDLCRYRWQSYDQFRRYYRLEPLVDDLELSWAAKRGEYLNSLPES